MTAEPQSWYWLRSGAGDPAFNMALDESLLQSAPLTGAPVLRFYGWIKPAASFGYFQRHVEVERLTPLRPLIRRPTAGGIVPHDGDWTYSLSIPLNTYWYQLKAAESYARMHRWLQSSFALLGIATELAERACSSGTGQCFAGYEVSDLLWHGRKIAGAAQRRSREGLLIQGSVQPSQLSVQRVEWEQAMLDAGPSGSAVQWIPFTADATLSARVSELAKLKYTQQSWNQRR